MPSPSTRVTPSRSWMALAVLGAVALLAGGLALPAALGKVKQATYTTGTFSTVIPDQDMIVESVRVRHRGTVRNVIVRVRIEHTMVGDLQLALVSPSGRVVKLSTNNGADGQNYGSGAPGCEGEVTVFRDNAQVPITQGTPPFDAAFQPEQSLRALNGSRVQGAWSLIVVDGALQDTGTLHCFELEIRRRLPRKR